MNILVVQTGFLGDVILSSAVFSNLRDIYPDASISVLTTPLAKDLVESNPLIKEVITYDKRKSEKGLLGLLSCSGKLKLRKFDIAYSLHKSFRTAVLLWMSKIPIRYGFSTASLPWLYTKTSPRADLDHEVLRNLAIFRNIAKEPKNLSSELSLYYPVKSAMRASELLAPLKSSRVVGVAPGSVWLTKRWTEEGFRAVIEQLLSDDYSVVMIGGPSDAEVAQKIWPNEHPQVLNLVGKTTLAESAAIVADLPLLITNDSAPLHMASALGTPVISLFCATIPEFGYGPWKTQSEVLGVSGLSCRPCGRHGAQSCPTGTHACRNQLGAEEVYSACQRMLGV